jgi:hypothetical protein
MKIILLITDYGSIYAMVRLPYATKFSHITTDLEIKDYSLTVRVSEITSIHDIENKQLVSELLSDTKSTRIKVINTQDIVTLTPSTYCPGVDQYYMNFDYDIEEQVLRDE